MIPRLTKEQAEWLIEQIKLKAKYRPTNSFLQEVFLFPIDIENTINNCVEKEFPEINMRPTHVDDTEEIKVYETYCDNAGKKCIVVYSYDQYTHMNKEQFKEFTEGCNKILQWLEGQQ